MFKSVNANDVFVGVYLTGILPIKKYNSQSALNNFADIVLIPRKNVDSPAIVIELKVDKDADSALDQIRRKQYPAKVAEYAANLLLVGISYDRQTKQHSCRIETCRP